MVQGEKAPWRSSFTAVFMISLAPGSAAGVGRPPAGWSAMPRLSDADQTVVPK